MEKVLAIPHMSMLKTTLRCMQVRSISDGFIYLYVQLHFMRLLCVS